MRVKSCHLVSENSADESDKLVLSQQAMKLTKPLTRWCLKTGEES